MTVRHKFFAKKCESDGIKFPSKLEAAYYNQLKVRQISGDVIFFLMQVPFLLPGKIKYLVDFMVFLNDGTIEFVDTKGMDTRVSINKRKTLEDVYPVKIKIVKA